MELKEHRGFYYDGSYVILADITVFTASIFGDGLVNKMLCEIDKYYSFSDNEIYTDYKDFINKKYDELSNNLNLIMTKGVSINDDGKPYLSVDGEDLIIEFINGAIISFNTSEWGSVNRL